MGESEEKLPPAKAVQPTSEDEAEKARVLKLWEDDRMTLLTWRPFIGILAMHLELVPVVDFRCKLDQSGLLSQGITHAGKRNIHIKSNRLAKACLRC